MTQEQIKQYIEDQGYDSVKVFESPSYCDAFIGISDNGRAVYDFEKMAEQFMRENECEYDEAVEFIEYNTIRALPYYPDGPIVVYPVLDYMVE